MAGHDRVRDHDEAPWPESKLKGRAELQEIPGDSIKKTQANGLPHVPRSSFSSSQEEVLEKSSLVEQQEKWAAGKLLEVARRQIVHEPACNGSGALRIQTQKAPGVGVRAPT